MLRTRDRFPRALLLLGAIAAGGWLRIRGLADMPFYGDEYHGIRAANRAIGEILTRFDSYGTHVVLPLLQHVLANTLGPTLVSFRLPALVPGLLCLLLCYPVARSLVGRAPALLATVALAASPIHVYYSRFGRAYSLNILLGLLLVWAVRRAHTRQWRGFWTVLLVVAPAALLPYAHLSSAGFDAGLGLAAIGLAWHAYGARAGLRALAVFAAAAVLCGLMFLPVFEPLIAYLTKLPEEERARPDGVLGIATLLAGGGYAGIVEAVLLVAGLVLLVRRQRVEGWLLAAAVVGPMVFLGATLPHGMEYAYARYLIIALPCILIVCSWVLVAFFERVVPGPAASGVGVFAGAALVAAVHLGGPLGPRAADSGPFSNTYLAMRDLPAFDRPYVGTPNIYRRIAKDPQAKRIIEAPPLHSRSVLLYRNYFQTHGKEVLIGLARAKDDLRLSGPSAFIGDPNVGRKSGAQYLILHRDLRAEVAGYWKWIYGQVWPQMENVWDRGFMDRHRSFFIPEASVKEMADALEGPLRQQLGPPMYEDDTVVAWRLRRGR